jgi:alpha-D-xyloside xylohydrolase
MIRPSICCKVFACIGAALLTSIAGPAAEAAQPSPLLNEPVDISPDFHDFTNTYFVADALASFDPSNASGAVSWKRNLYVTRQAFDNMLAKLQPAGGNEFPTEEYAVDPVLPFYVQFITPRTVRILMKTGLPSKASGKELMLVGELPKDNSWKYGKISGGHRYTSAFGSVTIVEKPWHIELRDAQGRLLTKTNHPEDNTVSLTPILPFSFVRRSSDYSRSVAAVFSLAPGEKIYGCGESFTRLDKRGQKVVLWTDDANGVLLDGIYKPVPFFMSSRGYGMFMHTTSPITCDIGATFGGTNTLLIGDDELDLFVFLGQPKEILEEYTNLTGKSPMPPLWSFGLWMSRITYKSEKEVRDVAAKLRENKIPADVIHLDTGWFETDWRCDYEFSTTRFTDPAKMIADLKNDGFHISLWQLSYFVPKNKLFPEIVEKGLVIKDAKGNLPAEDAMLDFSNPAAVKWYQEKIAGLLKLGVGAIKVDFGEAAPPTGLYASGRTGFYEHNLYPLRYNKVVADITKQVTGENVIWARSAWAGSQRYPLHWGGDAGTMDDAMAATLRGGLSLGLCGFSFWSHDIGGFTAKTPEELYRRWLPFGLLTSHSRCHGQPPKEPWEYGTAFMDDFRLADNLKYRLMPYVFAQAKDCTQHGLPMVRALFVEFPDDPGSWIVEDEYLFGSDMLVAPMMETAATERGVYLPPGKWIDYQTAKVYDGGWHTIKAGKIPVVLLVREGAVIPHVQVAQSTAAMDWSKIDLVVYAAEAQKARGLMCLPSDNILQEVSLAKTDGVFRLLRDPYSKKVAWNVKLYPENGK